jgi:hypothetical protein
VGLIITVLHVLDVTKALEALCHTIPITQPLELIACLL